MKSLSCLFLLCVLLCTACVDTQPTPDTLAEAEGLSVETEERSAETGGSVSAETEAVPSASVWTDADIRALLDQHAEFFRYTTYSTLPCENSTGASCIEVERDGMMWPYYPVTDARYDTWDEWVAFAEGIYSPEEAARRLDNTHVIGVEGITYTAGGEMGWYESTYLRYTVLEETADCLKIEVVHEDVFEKTERVYAYTLVYTDAGWRIGTHRDWPASFTADDFAALMEHYLDYEMYTNYESLPCDFSTPIHIEGQAQDFYPVTDARYDTRAEWVAFVESIFTIGVASGRIANDAHVAIVGETTYADGGSMGNPRSRDYTYDILSVERDTIVLAVHRRNVQTDEVETCAFTLYDSEFGWRIGEINRIE